MTSDQLKDLEATLWQSADMLRSDAGLKASEYATPILGLIFLRFADNKYSRFEDEILSAYQKLKGTRREKPLHEIAIEKCGFYLPEHARYEYLLHLPEKEDIAQAIKQAMAAIEEYKPELEDVLPQDEYFRLVNKSEHRSIPKQLLKNFADIPRDATGDMFGQIYEYFLGKFALAEGQGGGEFFTPRSVVRLMVEIIEPHEGTVFDPACGSGGMFVQCAHFMEQRTNDSQATRNLYVSGQEKTLETVKLAKMNLAVNGLRGEIRQANTYYDDVFDSLERFDYVLANPPFNVDEVSLNRVENDPRFNAYGIPRNKTKTKKKGDTTVPNANYLWINLFATSLKPTGRAGLVMANSASDARHSEADIRKSLIEHNLIYAMVTLPSNMFYTVTLPATLWFFDKAKTDDRILFIDARNIFTPIDRAHREFSDPQIQNIATIARLQRGDRQALVTLVDCYFAQGMERLGEHQDRLNAVAQAVTTVMQSLNGRDIPDFKPALNQIKTVQKAYTAYQRNLDLNKVTAANKKQHKLTQQAASLFTDLHGLLKALDKKVRRLEKDHAKDKDLKALKQDLSALHGEVKDVEYFFTHVTWLQDRFPTAQYEDVTGLCKLADLDEIAEQDYSLNPGRYVGVVIEEDGKTEEEFIAEILGLNEELTQLNRDARKLEKAISKNISAMTGDA